MKKIILSILLIIMISCVFCTTCFASGSETVTFSCYTTTSLTKSIVVKATSSVTINWGDGTIEEYSAVEKIAANHTYSNSGSYNVSLSADNITNLLIGNNDIYEIDLSQVTLLEELDVKNNKIVTLDLSKNLAIETLIASNNDLTTLNIASDNITVLNCVNNKISSISVPKTINELYIGNNEISSFNLTGFSALKILECQDNNISSLALTDCSELEILNCSNNFITSLSLTNNLKLKELYCYGNEIQSLDISNNSLLQVLNCVGNSLATLNVSNNINLQELYVFQNQITDINLNNIDIVMVIVDDVVNIISNTATTLIKMGITGNGGAEINSNKVILFSSIPNKLLINDIEQTNVNSTLDVSQYTGNYNVVAIFDETEESEYVIVNKPQLVEGMIPVKHNGTNWVITNVGDSEWYNYSTSNMKWANVMLRDNAYYLDVDGKTLKSVGSTSLDALIGREIPEIYTGSMYVWIPRFTYKVMDNGIDIKYSGGFDDYIEAEYKVHPAFNYANYIGGDAFDYNNYTNLNNTDKYLGIWVAKYPAGKNINNPQYVKNASEILNASIGEAFSASKLTASSSVYGLTNATSHMMKNTEWGAVAYFTTGVGSLQNDSTTGNIYGIFGMNDTAEYVSSYIELVGGISNFSVRKNGKSLLTYNIISYSDYTPADIKDIEILKLKSVKDDASLNYSALSSFYGNGITEVSDSITGSITKNVPYGSNAFLIRGIDGIYSYSGTNGESTNNVGFRNVILRKDNSSTTETQTFIIKSSSNIGGTISPAGNTVVKEGKNITYSMIPNDGYEIIDVIVDNISVYKDLDNFTSYSTYTFENVVSNHEISVIFDYAVAEYQVTVNQNPQGAGEIEGEGAYNSRSTVTLSANGKSGYKFSGWEIEEGLDSIIDSSSSVITFKMPSNNVILKANFVEALRAMLRVENLYGIISMEKDVGVKVNVVAGESDEYVFDCWIAEGIELTTEQINSSSIEIEMPSQDVRLVAKYNKLYPVVITLGDGTVVETYYPETKEVKLTAQETVNGKSFSGWSVSGLESGLSSEREVTFIMPSNKVEITVLYNN